ncbi:MAG: hypothetical protein JWN46_2516 [Acidimicrobiales bacterium]|nr:hypothetical protein [Acidimicrobiales bacterium]
MARTTRARGVAAGIAAVALLVAGGCSSSKKDSASTTTAVSAATTTSAATATTAPTTAAPTAGPVTIQAGINDPVDPTVAVLQYMPAKATVKVGEKVRWSWTGTTEPHSVTFFPPGQTPPTPDKADPLFPPTAAKGAIDGTAFVNSGLQPLAPGQPPTFEASFAKAGTYKYVCVIHPQMIGTIDVVAGSGGETAAAVAARGQAEQKQWIAEGEAVAKKLRSAPASSTKNADGTTTWKVAMGASGPHTDVLAFAPDPASVKAGDKVLFVNSSGAPHTATFFGATPPIQSPLDPKGRTAYPGPLTAAGFFGTGLLPPDAPPGAGPPEAVRSYSFVVPKAGSYKYVCILHAASGMAGIVTAT